MEKFYYHITSVENAQRIIKEGLKANEDGQIFLFENKSVETYGFGKNRKGKLCFGMVSNFVADSIATNQIFLDKYAMLEVSAEGIKGELILDDVVECTRGLCWIAEQPIIEAKYIEPFCIAKPERFGKLTKELREATDEELKVFGYGE